MSKVRWITRDLSDDSVDMWRRRPWLDDNGVWKSASGEYEDFCCFAFGKYTGIKLKPGEIAKIRFEKIEVRK